LRLRGYRFEPLVLVLVALAALPPISLTGPQDRTRYELTRHIVLYQTLTVENELFDRSLYHGHSFSDKAPGMSFLAVPAYQLERVLGIARIPTEWRREGDITLWLVRVLTSGVLFLLAVLVVGRLAEGIVAGTGALTAAVFGVATIAAPLAPTLFEHDSAGALAITAFALLWRGRRPWAIALAGFCAGAAVLFQYATGVIGVVLAVYAAIRHGRRAAWYVLGAVPAAIALAAYNWSAFGSPFHLSYRYVANAYTEKQHRGFFGIGVPSFHGLREELIGSRGLLWYSPVCFAAAVGLWLLWRRGTRAEAAVCAVVTVAFVLLNGGYFLPYGGGSPGPRFLAPALPFLLLGLPCALARFRWPTLALALVSTVLMSIDALSWGVRKEGDPSWLPGKNDVMTTAWMWLGLHRDAGAAVCFGFALAAFAVGTVALVRR
jgi:hypothetical protein